METNGLLSLLLATRERLLEKDINVNHTLSFIAEN